MISASGAPVTDNGFLSEILRRYTMDGRVEPYRGIYRVTGSVPKILKPLKTGAVQAYLVAKLLSQSDGSLIPKLVKTADERGYLWLRGNRVLMTEQLPGNPADYRNDWDLDAAISAMSRWHRLTRDLVAGETAQWEPLWFDIRKVWLKRLLELDACREMAIRRQDAFSREYLRKWREFSDQAYHISREMIGSSLAAGRTPQVLCYHDWAFHNILVDGPDAFLVDFDLMILDAATHDRANLIGRYLRLFLWKKEALLKILWKFDRRYPWGRGELRLLRLYLSFPYDYWMIGRQYYIEKQPWSRKYFWDQWQRKIVQQENRMRTLLLLEKLESRG